MPTAYVPKSLAPSFLPVLDWNLNCSILNHYKYPETLNLNDRGHSQSSGQRLKYSSFPGLYPWVKEHISTVEILRLWVSNQPHSEDTCAALLPASGPTPTEGPSLSSGPGSWLELPARTDPMLQWGWFKWMAPDWTEFLAQQNTPSQAWLWWTLREWTSRQVLDLKWNKNFNYKLSM